MSKIDDIKARHAKELAAAEAEDSIRALLPENLREQARIHVHALYGSCASIKFEGPYAGPALNLEFVATVADALPAVATTLVKDSCTSFRPTSYVEGLPEEKKERWKEETSVSPMRLNIEPVTSVRLEAEWFASLPDGRIVTVEVVMGYPPPFLGRYTAKRIEFKGGHRYENASWSSAGELHTIMNGGEPVAQLESPIRWASGSPEYPNRMTLYFVDLGADLAPAFVASAIAKHLVAMGSKVA